MLYIQTLTWNGAEKLTKLKNSLLPCLEDISYTWGIKDNGSKDDSVEMIKSWENPNVSLIEYPSNSQNFSEGMNHIFHHFSPTSSDQILLLNNDVEFKDVTSIKKMIGLLKKDVGAVGCRLLYADNPTKLQHAGVVFSPTHLSPLHFRLNQETDSNAEKNREFQCVTGAVYLTTAECYRNAYKNSNGTNGMDENFRWAFDDVDLSLSIRYNQNKKIIYCGSTNILHEESASLKKNPVNKLHMNHNLNLFRSKWKSKIKFDQFEYEQNPKKNIIK